MKFTTLTLAIALLSTSLFAQKKVTTSGTIAFDATTSLDALPKAENKTVVAALDTKSGAIAFEAIVKSFSFTNPMMQDHFNSDKWLDSDKFPTAVFKGKVININEIDLKKDGVYVSNVTGDLTIHGVTKPATAVGSMVVTGKSITATASFKIKLDEYGISSKAIDAGKDKKEPSITVVAEFK